MGHCTIFLRKMNWGLNCALKSFSRRLRWKVQMIHSISFAKKDPLHSVEITKIYSNQITFPKIT